MSDKPLWTDEQIEAEMRRIGDNMRLYIADACSVAEQVRDDYEAALTAAEEQLRDCRAELAELKRNGHIPQRDTVGGLITTEWDTPQEDAAWEHLGEDNDGSK